MAKMSMFCDWVHSASSSRRPRGPSVLVLRELIIVRFLQRTMRDDVGLVGPVPFPSGDTRLGRFKAAPSFNTLVCVS